MINGASPITFQLKASLKRSSSTLEHTRASDRLCTGFAIPFTMPIYVGTILLTPSHTNFLTHTHFCKISVHMCLCVFALIQVQICVAKINVSILKPD